MRQTWLRGEDGRLYVADRAPADMLYTGLYRGYEQRSEPWGEQATRRFYNPLLAPVTRYEDGYTAVSYTHLVGNLGRSAASIAAQQAAQRAARDAALAAGGSVPDGLAERCV